MIMKHIFIINPAAGKGNRLYELKAKIHAACRKCGVDYFIYETKGVGDAASFAAARAAEGKPLRLYACGGDGTLNEVVSGAIGASHVAVGLIPMGTGNDFHRNFSHGEKFFSIESQLHGRVDRIDLLRCNGHPCINMLNIGFDCDVVVATERIKRRIYLPTEIAYIVGILQRFCGKIGTQFTVRLDGEKPLSQPMTLFTAANGRFCGGGFQAAPFASLKDGEMDLCMVGKVTHTMLVRVIGSYRKGTHFENSLLKDCLEYRRVKQADIIFPRAHLLCIDGETMYAKRLHLTVEPAALSFICPRGARPLAYERPHGNGIYESQG